MMPLITFSGLTAHTAHLRVQALNSLVLEFSEVRFLNLVDISILPPVHVFFVHLCALGHVELPRLKKPSHSDVIILPFTKNTLLS